MNEMVLCVFDIDGTLYNEGEITPRMQRVLKATSASKHWTVATGRGWHSTRYALGDLIPTAPLVLHDGGLVMDLNANVLASHEVPPLVVNQLERVITQAPVDYASFCPCGTDEYRVYARNREGYRRLVREMPRANLKHIPSVSEFLKLASDRVTKIALRVTGPLTLPRDVPAFRSDGWVDVLAHQGVSKAAGVQLVAKKLGIPFRRVGVAGNDLNDLPMLACSEFGCRVAVGENCPPELREIPGVIWVPRLECAFR